MTKAQLARASSVTALVAAFVGIAGAALAQRPSEEQIAHVRQACRSDYIAHCASIQPGGAEALMCLRQHLTSLSAPCQEAVNAVAAPDAVPAPTAAEVPPAPAPAPTT